MTGMDARKDWGMTTLLSETLRYASPQKPVTTARFDGNISEITFASYSGGSTPSSDTYGYTYDGLKRLTDAAHYTGTSTTSDNLKTEKDIAYDRNGNLTGLNRYGSLGLEGMLSFTHTGNRLTGVTVWDGTNLPSSYTATYDAKGNLVTDTRKGLQFSYNLANLPRKVEGMAGSASAGLTLSYGYLADGTKTSALLSSVSGAVDGLKYRGSFVYEVSGSSERLGSVAWDEGRIAIDYSQNAANPDIRDEWHVRDHLGNTRMVVNLTDYGTVIEKNEYLPFGTRIANSLQSTSNRYRLGGKEEQRFGTGASSLDLRLSDFGARYYDPFTCRWTTCDPLAGKYHSWSPYNYCGNNPIRFSDPNGLDRKDRVVGRIVGVATNLIPGSGFVRDLYAPADASDYNAGLKQADISAAAAGVTMLGGGGAMMAAGETVMATGGALAVSVAGAPEGVAVATGGASIAGAGVVSAGAGLMLMANTAKNKSEGYGRGRGKFDDSIDHGKNEKHGDGGRAFSKSEQQRKALQENIDNASSKKERNILSNKLKHIIRDAQYKEKGEEHSRGNKR
jgi:RHS repeat-associated protein